MQDEPIRYSRSQCARLFGISMDTLRYYERIGLLHVARDKRSRQCVYIGRIIGKLVAQPASDNMQESVMDGRANYEPEKKAASYETAANEYIGEGKGKGGTPIRVKVTMDGDKIANIEVLEQAETAGISDPAFEKVIADILAKQSTDVDVVSGVTLTSNGIIEAVNNALAQVK